MATEFKPKAAPAGSLKNGPRSETKSPLRPPIPPLRNGDRLTADEFLRRYEAMPGVKAELIDGRVYLAASPVRDSDGKETNMASPVRHREHGGPQFRIVGWLCQYVAATPGSDGGDNSTLRLDLDNMPQPDAFLRVLPEYGGQTQDTDDGYVTGGPELVTEVAASSVSYDLHDKLNAYRRHGVREYLVWRVEDAAFDWFVLRGGRYEPLPAAPDGLLKSETFPGLWLDPAALLRGDLATVLETLRRGLESPEHAAFVEKLRAAATPPAA